MPDQSFRKHFMQLRKLALVFIAGAAILAFFAFDLGQYLNLQTLKDQQAAISQFHEDKPLLSVATYFVDYGLMAAFHLPGSALLTLGGARGVRCAVGVGGAATRRARACGPPAALSRGGGRGGGRGAVAGLAVRIVFAEPDGSGWKVLVAIADVAHYVTSGSPPDREAWARGNSGYFPDRSRPKPPQAQPNGAGSRAPDTPTARWATPCSPGAPTTRRGAGPKRIHFGGAGRRVPPR